MISVYKFMELNGLRPNHLDDQADMRQVRRMLYDYAKAVREEQILLCAATAAAYTAKSVRGVPERLDDDYKSHLVVPRVCLGDRFPD